MSSLEIDNSNRQEFFGEGSLSIRDTFNGTIVSAAICAAYELGLLDELNAQRSVDTAKFAADNDLDLPVVSMITTALAYAGVVEKSEAQGKSRLVQGARFAELWRNKGYFLWLISGYGPMLTLAAEQCRLLGSGIVKFERNGASIAKAAGDYGHEFVDEIFDSAVGELEFYRAADIGCGDASRLIRLAQTRPGCRFVGIDADQSAVAAAQANVARAGLSAQIEIALCDAENLRPDEFSGVDLVFSFFMGHDFWPMPRCLAALSGIRKAFPDVRHFMLADTYRSTGSDPTTAPIFTLGFEFTHALMGKYVPTLREWEIALATSEWQLAATHKLDIPYSVIFDLRPEDI